MALRRWIAVLVPGAVLYLAPLPGLAVAQRHLLAVFLATILALVVRPAPMVSRTQASAMVTSAVAAPEASRLAIKTKYFT